MTALFQGHTDNTESKSLTRHSQPTNRQSNKKKRLRKSAQFTTILPPHPATTSEFTFSSIKVMSFLETMHRLYNYRGKRLSIQFLLLHLTSLTFPFTFFVLKHQYYPHCLSYSVSLWSNMLHTTFIFPKKVWGDVECGDWKRLVIALPAFLCLSPVGLKTIYTATEEAPHSLRERYAS